MSGCSNATCGASPIIRNLSRYLAELRAWPGVEETIDYFHIKHHYYESLKFINPTGIVPRGPAGANEREMPQWVSLGRRPA